MAHGYMVPRWAILALALFAATAAGQDKIAPEARKGEPWALTVTPDGRKLAAARGFQDAGGALVVWDLIDGTQTILGEYKRGLLAAAFSPDGSKLACGGFDSVLRVFDMANGKLLHQFTGNKGPINAIAWAPDGSLVATAGLDKTVRLWDLDNGRQLHAFEGHAEWVLNLAYSPDNRWLVSAGKDQVLKIWDIESKKERFNLTGHKSGIQSVAISPDARVIASGSWDQHIRLWDAATGKEKFLLKGHTNGVFALRFTPDSKALVSASGAYNYPNGQGEIKFWDVETGKDRATLFGHVGGIWSVAFSPDGRTLYTGGADQTIKIWEVATERQRLALLTMGKGEPSKDKTELTPEDLQRIGKALSGADARLAYAAVRQLVRAPTQAVPWLCKLVQPADANRQKQLRRWIAQLDDEDAAVRAAAAEQLEKAGPAALPILRQVAEEAAVPELRQRAAELLKKIGPGGGISEQVHLGRALEALELIGNAEAQAHLAMLAKGPADTWLTRAAQQSLHRIERRMSQ
jgi:hypothetical protein